MPYAIFSGTAFSGAKGEQCPSDAGQRYSFQRRKEQNWTANTFKRAHLASEERNRPVSSKSID